MTGPEHYRTAERLVDFAIPDSGQNRSERAADVALMAAQVHATLALAAATAMSGSQPGGMHDLDYMAWDKACGVQEGTE